MNCQFSFAPNRGYFFSTGPGCVYAWSENLLPTELSRLLKDETHPQALDTSYDAAFPMDPETYMLYWKGKGGEDWYEASYLWASYTRLAHFMKDVATNGDHTTPILRLTIFQYVVLNPFVAGEYYAVYGHGTSTWLLPPTWDDNVKVVQIQGSPLADPAPEAVIVESDPAVSKYFPCAKMTRGPFNLRDHVSNVCFGLRMDLEEDFSYSDNSWYKTLRHLTDYEGCQRRPPAEPSILRNLSRHQYVRESSLRELKVKYVGTRMTRGNLGEPIAMRTCFSNDDSVSTPWDGGMGRDETAWTDVADEVLAECEEILPAEYRWTAEDDEELEEEDEGDEVYCT
ncbi:hypothetical protein DFH09DRAFT_1493868 [Mycena vulgaris]|nr:hypothetical protein DFH09DRAFT_1493868 [Mycena vulgaris]